MTSSSGSATSSSYDPCACGIANWSANACEASGPRDPTADTVSRQAAEFLMTSGRPYLQKPFDVRNYRSFISNELD